MKFNYLFVTTVVATSLGVGGIVLPAKAYLLNFSGQVTSAETGEPLDDVNVRFDVRFRDGSYIQSGGIPRTEPDGSYSWGYDLDFGRELEFSYLTITAGYPFDPFDLRYNSYEQRYDSVCPLRGGCTAEFDLELEAIPEPLTILGAVSAVGFGAIFKRKLSQVKKS